MTVDQKLVLLEQEISKLLVTKITQYHCTQKSQIAMLNSFLVLADIEDASNIDFFIESATTKIDFQDFVSYENICVELVNYKLKESDMSFEYGLLVLILDTEDHLEFIYNSKHGALILDIDNRDYFKQHYTNDLDRLINLAQKHY
jgi:hypothetical protein